MRAAIELATDETPGPDAPEFYAFTHFDNTSSQNVLARLQFEGQAWDRVLG